VPSERPKHVDFGQDRQVEQTTVHFTLPNPKPPVK
jgi:hypothetical protein